MNQSKFIPRVLFAALPTPVEPMLRLQARLAMDTGRDCPRLYVKRDDLTGLAFGGNKTRKLEYALAEAQANGARTVITVGAAQSNHCRQTAAMAARVGMDCILVLSGSPAEPVTGNLLLDHLFGAEIVWSTREERGAVLAKTFDSAWAAGRRPYLIPLGASNALGAVSYETAFQEFLDQNVDVDWIVVASSSGGTQAGLVLGAHRAAWNGKVLGISIDEPEKELQQVVARYAGEAAERLGDPWRPEPGDILVNDGYLGEGYGIMGKAEREAIALVARTEGLLLDPVYTGRATAGMIDLIRKGYFAAQSRILFWHTGGAPALFADRYASALFEE